jgi:hypothetical protein
MNFDSRKIYEDRNSCDRVGLFHDAVRLQSGCLFSSNRYSTDRVIDLT